MHREKAIKVMISGGGTGGHINPALAIAEEIRRRYPDVRFLFVGAQGRMEMERIPAAGYEILGLPIMGLDRKRIWRNGRVLLSWIRSRLLARQAILEFTPHLVIGVGGYASAPTLKEAQKLGLPTLLQEQNSYAGISNKLLAKRASVICVAYPHMDRFFPADRMVLTGNPVRHAIEYNSASEREAEEYFGFVSHSAPSPQTILVMGGSLGARSINQATITTLDFWLEQGYRIIWQTGKSFESEAQLVKEKYQHLHHQLYISTYVDRMDFAYRLADVIVSRAGACSISEICLSGKPCILIPSPNVAEDHQTKNAKALSTEGAALLIHDAEASDLMGLTVHELLKAPERCREIVARAQRFATPDAVKKIVDQVELLL